jgi:alpha-galactosidase
MITARLTYNNKVLNVWLNKSTIEEDLFVSFTEEKTPQYSRLKLDIHPKKEVKIQSLEIKIEKTLNVDNQYVMCNGFQSWSETRPYRFDEQPDALRSFAKPLMGYYGDYHFDFIPRKKGTLHAWTYGYLMQNDSDEIDFIGSLNESTGFTCLLYDATENSVIIKKDVEGLVLNHSFPALDILMMSGDTPSVFDTYFDLQDIKKPQYKATSGWTSWYNHYNKISEKIITDNLKSFKDKDLRIDIFQIDDGWETRIGDWLSIKPSFPNGMKPIADAIHRDGFKAGLWLAPFIVESASILFKEKPDWILRGPNGKPIPVGYAGHWSGRFYALDFYNKGVQEYLTGVFHTVLDKWGFDMVKLDFLYAVCVLPRPNKTRGQIMHEAMTFLRSLIGDKIFLACGVPLGSSFGLTDYCRIGADIHLQWEHKLLKFLKNRERVSTIVALRTTLNRWQLNGRAFLNDPDVFILRADKHQLKKEEKETVFWLNWLLGDLLFCSDDVKEYDAETMDLYKNIFALDARSVQSVKYYGNDLYGILFQKEGKQGVCYCNLSENVSYIEGIEVGGHKLVFSFRQ